MNIKGQKRLPAESASGDLFVRNIVSCGAIFAPVLHTLTDIVEWLQGGFTELQLWVNYIAFLPIPAILVGLFVLQRPRIAWYGLVGALLYGFAFIYFAHSTLFAIAKSTATYGKLWGQLGWLYSLHGGTMILGGILFSIASARAAVLPKWTSILFGTGLLLHLILA